MKFKDINDIVEWLEPMDYETFWREITPYRLVMLPRGKCDRDIAGGSTDEETVLIVMKSLARMELASVLKLDWREPMLSTAVH